MLQQRGRLKQPNCQLTTEQHTHVNHSQPLPTPPHPPPSYSPGDLVGVNKDSYLILDSLPAEYDSRVKAMEVDEKPSEDYSDIGGLDKQIQELVEAIVLPITHKDRFKNLGIKPPKGVLLYGPPGTGVGVGVWESVGMHGCGNVYVFGCVGTLR